MFPCQWGKMNTQKGGGAKTQTLVWRGPRAVKKTKFINCPATFKDRFIFTFLRRYYLFLKSASPPPPPENK